MMTVREVAERLKVSKGLVYKLINSGELSSYRIGGTIRITEQQVRDYLGRPRDANSFREFKHLRL